LLQLIHSSIDGGGYKLIDSQPMPRPAKKTRNNLILKLHKKKDKAGRSLNGYKKLAKIFGVDWSRIRQIIKANQDV